MPDLRMTLQRWTYPVIFSMLVLDTCHKVYAVMHDGDADLEHAFQNIVRDKYDIVLNKYHLDDLLFDHTGRATRHAVLILYTHDISCHKRVDETISFLIKNLDEHLPPQHQFSIMMHDFQECETITWFDIPQDDLLNHVFKLNECPSLFFINKGSKMTDTHPVFALKKDKKLLPWLHKYLENEHVIRNEHDDILKIIVGNRSNPNKVSYFTLNKKLEKTFECQSGCEIIIYTAVSGDFVMGKLLEEPSTIIIPKDPQFYNKEQDWQQSVRKPETEIKNELKKFRTYQAKMHYNIIAQPRVLQHLTKSGFKKTLTPPDIHNHLLEFYNRYADIFYEEDEGYFVKYRASEPYVPKMSCPEDEAMNLANQLKPIVERFCGNKCQLQPVKGDGPVMLMFKHKRGSQQKMHVDDFHTGHVVTAIMHLTHRLDDEDSAWPLEIIGFDGKRKTVDTVMGEMVILESGTVIHGRPSTLEGSVFVEVHFYYQTNDWDPKVWGQTMVKKSRRKTMETSEESKDDKQSEGEDIFGEKDEL